jgi:quinol monooxygenase YgiN
MRGPQILDAPRYPVWSLEPTENQISGATARAQTLPKLTEIDPKRWTAEGMQMSDLTSSDPLLVPNLDEDLEISMLQLSFRASDPDVLLSVLSKYVVLTRNVQLCRNVDLCVSYTDPTRFVIIEKWESEDAAREHLDSRLMVEMAQGCDGVLSAPPDIDMLEGVSAHDLA